MQDFPNPNLKYQTHVIKEQLSRQKSNELSLTTYYQYNVQARRRNIVDTELKITHHA